MKYVRFQVGRSVSYGLLKGESIYVIRGNLFGRPKQSGKRVALKKARILAPCKPGKIIAIGRNYKTHIGDRAAPTKPEMFLKTASSIQDPEGDIVIPKISRGNLHYEGELVVVIGKRGKHLSAADAGHYVFGYTLGNDVSERDWQSGPDKDLQWARAKSSDTFTPLGPCIATELEPRDLHIQTRLNGQVVQDQGVADLCFDVPEIIAQITQSMTLEPGDLIFTGTPGQTAAMHPGDVVEVEIKEIGVLRNHVKSEA